MMIHVIAPSPPIICLSLLIVCAVPTVICRVAVVVAPGSHSGDGPSIVLHRRVVTVAMVGVFSKKSNR